MDLIGLSILYGIIWTISIYFLMRKIHHKDVEISKLQNEVRQHKVTNGILKTNYNDMLHENLKLHRDFKDNLMGGKQ